MGSGELGIGFRWGLRGQWVGAVNGRGLGALPSVANGQGGLVDGVGRLRCEWFIRDRLCGSVSAGVRLTRMDRGSPGEGCG